jgi:hypothetical protein
MQKKIPYPIDGIIRINGSRYIHGEGNWWSKKKKARVNKYYFIKRYQKCDFRSVQNETSSGFRPACDMRATFYGYETIGPRVYSIHRCVMGHRNLARLIQNDGPELTAFLKKK